MGGASAGSNKKFEENFEKRAIYRNERKKARDTNERVGDLSWLSHLPEEVLWAEWDKISARLTLELERAKLWHPDNDKCMVPNENGIPSSVKNKLYSKEGEETGEDYLDPEDAYDPEWVDDVVVSGALPEEEELADEDEPELIETGVWDVRQIGPKAPFSNMQFLMRRRPKDLSQSLARALIEANYFHYMDPLLPALCFYEVGIENEPTFTDVREDAYVGCPIHLAGKQFSFAEYQKDKLKLSHVIRRQKQGYFDHNRFLWRSVARVSKVPDTALKSLWERFLEVNRSLTPKQRNAVRDVYIKGRAQTRVAKGMRITLDSLRDRLEGARIKFQNALPELAPFRVSETYKSSKKRRLLYWGLFDKVAAATVQPLFRIDPDTNARQPIALRAGKPKAKLGMNLSKIKAWAHSTTLVPDFGFTDYFTMLIPQGHLDRISSPRTLHDVGATFPNYDNKRKAHVLTSEDDGTDDAE